MKKIITILGLFVLVVVGFAGCSYYNKTYKSEEAYAIVPSEIPEKVEETNADGKVQEGLFKYEYNLTFIKADGTSEEMDFSVTGENPEPLPAGAYIKAEISETRVTSGPTVIEESEVPQKVLEKLNGQ